MGKKLIDRKYLEKIKLVKNSIFILQPDYILTPYASDLLCEKGIRVVRGDGSENTNDFDLNNRIINILKNDFGIDSNKIAEELAEKIISRIN